MTDLKQHFAARGTASSLLTSRFSKHPERYFQRFQVFRKYELDHDDDHGRQLGCALEELGLLPADYARYSLPSSGRARLEAAETE